MATKRPLVNYSGTIKELQAGDVIAGADGGDVVGPSSSTDNAVTRFDGTTGKLVQNSTVTLDDNGTLANVNAVLLDTTPGTLPTASGSIYWDSGNKTPTVLLENDVALQVGQEQVALVYNGTGSTITNGSVVAVTGAQGQRPSVVLADADSENTSANTLGIATQDIANGDEGYITTFGLVRGLNTAAYTAGAPIYLSQTTGQFTSTRPSAPAHTVILGWVIKVNASSGELFVNINNGWELDELHNVKITSPSTGQILSYDSAAGYWKNITPAGGGDAYVGSTNTFTANQIIEVTDNSNAALRVTQLGTGDAIRVEDSTNPDSSPFIVKADGKVGIGTAAPSNALDVVATEPFVKISTSSSGLSAFYQATNPEGTFYAGKDRNGSAGLYGSAGQYVIAGSGNYPMDFWVNNNKALTINANGNIDVPGTGKRITGDFSNATLSNRLSFQSSTTNGNTIVQALPNGTSTTARMNFFNSSSPDNSSFAQLAMTSDACELISSKAGTGTYLPITVYTGDTERLRLSVNGGLGLSGTNYGTSGQVLTSNGDAPPTWTTVSGGGGGAVANGCIYENNLTITANYTLTTSKNGFSVGPITIDSGVVVTVPSGQRWVVL